MSTSAVCEVLESSYIYDPDCLPGEGGDFENDVSVKAQQRLDIGDVYSEISVTGNIGKYKTLRSEKGRIRDYRIENGFFDDSVYRLLGKGKVGMSSGGECGTIPVWTHNCSNLKCMHPLFTWNHCKKKSCPVCYPIGLTRSSNMIAARLLSIKAVNRNRNRRLVEFYVSWDSSKDSGSGAELKANINGALAYAKRMGARGGAKVIHMVRATAEAKAEAKKAGKPVWVWIREQEDEWKWYYYSPHIHFLGYIGYMKKNTTGGKYHYGMKTDGDNRPIDYLKDEEPTESLIKRARYMLSHTGYFVDNPEFMDNYTWTGNCSRKSFKITAEEVASLRGKPKPCPLCGSPVISYFEAKMKMLYWSYEWDYDPPNFWIRGDECDKIMVEFEK